MCVVALTQVQRMNYNDARMRLTNEVLNGIKVIHLCNLQYLFYL